jgi:hypothetical protein
MTDTAPTTTTTTDAQARLDALAFGLQLIEGSRRATDKLRQELDDAKDREIASLRASVNRLCDDAADVARLHTMLADPVYARRLMSMLTNPEFFDDTNPEFFDDYTQGGR